MTFGSSTIPLGVFEVADPDSSDARGSGIINVTIVPTFGEVSFAMAMSSLSELPTLHFGVASVDVHEWVSNLSFLATETDLNIALGMLQYRAPPRFVGADTVTVEISDNGNWGTGGVLTASAHVSVDVLPSN